MRHQVFLDGKDITDSVVSVSIKCSSELDTLQDLLDPMKSSNKAIVCYAYGDKVDYEESRVVVIATEETN